VFGYPVGAPTGILFPSPPFLGRWKVIFPLAYLKKSVTLSQDFGRWSFLLFFQD
jgi:hypothetical protein